MEILDKKSNRMSRANAGVFECNEFPDLQRILDFLSLRNLLSNELFFTFLLSLQ
jgi:riboflavin synthase alpha chain (fragment)